MVGDKRRSVWANLLLFSLPLFALDLSASLFRRSMPRPGPFVTPFVLPTPHLSPPPPPRSLPVLPAASLSIPLCQVSFLRLCNHVYAIADNSIVGFGRQHPRPMPHGRQPEEETESEREAVDKALEEVTKQDRALFGSCNVCHLCC